MQANSGIVARSAAQGVLQAVGDRLLKKSSSDAPALMHPLTAQPALPLLPLARDSFAGAPHPLLKNKHVHRQSPGVACKPR